MSPTSYQTAPPRGERSRLPSRGSGSRPRPRYNCPMRSVDGAVAVITGAGSGIGRATALSLAGRGCAVVVSDLDEERARAVSAEIEALGGRAASARCDVASDDDVSALAATTMSAFGRVD